LARIGRGLRMKPHSGKGRDVDKEKNTSSKGLKNVVQCLKEACGLFTPPRENKFEGKLSRDEKYGHNLSKIQGWSTVGRML